MKVKCIFCSRSLTVTGKGNLPTHVTAGNVKCVGIGSKANAHNNHAKLLSFMLASKLPVRV